MTKGFIPTKKKDRLIQAAGKSISNKNAEGITSARDSIASGLDSLDAVIEASGIGPAMDEVNASNFEKVGLINCSDYGEYLKRSNWFNRLRTALDGFGWNFESCLYEGSEPGEPSEVEEMIVEFSDEIRELAKLYKPLMQASVLQASNLRLECSRVDILEASSHGNKIPIEVKLFECDRTSSGIPSKGPGKKLYIPKSVALSIAANVASLPLDADPSLSQHCNHSIVGSMISATIKPDGDFWVRAHLHPFNQPELVAKIRADKNILGASINAFANGEDREIDGEIVHYITSMELLGANLLYKDCATFSGTEIKAQAAITGLPNNDPVTSPVSTLQPIAASNIAIEDKMNEELLKKLSEQFVQLSASTEILTKGLTVLLEDREAAIKSKELELAAAAQEQTLDSKIAAMVRNALNPSGQPTRITSGPIAASTEAPTLNESILAMNTLQASIDTLEGLGRADQTTRVKLIGLKDQLRVLKATAQ